MEDVLDTSEEEPTSAEIAIESCEKHCMIQEETQECEDDFASWHTPKCYEMCSKTIDRMSDTCADVAAVLYDCYQKIEFKCDADQMPLRIDESKCQTELDNYKSC
jgi:hypothetical protein